MIILAALVMLIIFLLWVVIDILETSYEIDKLLGENQERWKRILGK